MEVEKSSKAQCELRTSTGHNGALNDGNIDSLKAMLERGKDSIIFEKSLIGEIEVEVQSLRDKLTSDQLCAANAKVVKAKLALDTATSLVEENSKRIPLLPRISDGEVQTLRRDAKEEHARFKCRLAYLKQVQQYSVRVQKALSEQFRAKQQGLLHPIEQQEQLLDALKKKIEELEVVHQTVLSSDAVDLLTSIPPTACENNRNELRTQGGLNALTVPVLNEGHSRESGISEASSADLLGASGSNVCH